MERLKRKLRHQGISIFEFDKQEYSERLVRLKDKPSRSQSTVAHAAVEPELSIPIYSAILAIDESAVFYTERHIFDDFCQSPDGQRSAISIYQKNIFESIEVASFFIQNVIPDSLSSLRRINYSDLTELNSVYIITN